MSQYLGGSKAVTVRDVLAAKGERKLAMVTCYDASFARLVEKSPVDMVLVGDSLGNVMLGYEDTLQVTVDDMIHHCKSVARVLKRPFLTVDMPFMSYKISPEQALENAARLVQEGGAQAVKLEGGEEIAEAVARISAAGIPVVTHLGLTPQSVHSLGGHRVQGREDAAQARMLKDALALQEAGSICLVLELVPAELAGRLSAELKIPTIGIGAGVGCDGQVLVLQDLLGFDAGFSPKFLKKYADLDKIVGDALNQYCLDVKEGAFPEEGHSFS